MKRDTSARARDIHEWRSRLSKFSSRPHIPGRYFIARELPSSLMTKFRTVDLDSDHSIKIFGERIILMGKDEGISRDLMLFGIHEPLTTNVLRGFLRRDMVCMEIGANIGYYLLLEASIIGPKGRIIAIEPAPRTFEYLRRTVSMNQLNNVDIYQCAIGNVDGTVDFVVGKFSNLNHVLSDNEKREGADVISLPSKKLGTFVEETGVKRLDLLRMDVEGYESAIVSGGLASIRRLRPSILMEVHVSASHSKTSGMLQDLREMGYQMRCCIPRDWDLPLVRRFYHPSWRIDISSFIRRVERNQMPFSYNVFLEA